MPAVQTVSKKKKKLDPDVFLLEGKTVAKAGLQMARLVCLNSLHSHCVISRLNFTVFWLRGANVNDLFRILNHTVMFS